MSHAIHLKVSCSSNSSSDDEGSSMNAQGVDRAVVGQPGGQSSIMVSTAARGSSLPSPWAPGIGRFVVCGVCGCNQRPAFVTMTHFRGIMAQYNGYHGPMRECLTRVMVLLILCCTACGSTMCMTVMHRRRPHRRRKYCPALGGPVSIVQTV